MNTAELFVRCLVAEGVERVFAVPGEENAHVILALEDSPITIVNCRHEQGAAFICDAHGRLTGEAGVCLTTLGPGATNVVTGLANANMDHAPVVCITGQGDSQRQHKESHQIMDVVGLMKPITKWSMPVYHPSTVPEVVRKAFKVATTEKPGACHIEIAEDIAGAPVDARPLPVRRLRRPVPDDKIVDLAWEAIRAARRPLILAGNGAIRRRASRQLRLFCGATGISVVSTFMGKGAVARSAPECLFTVGLHDRDHVACAFDDADLVICLGYDLVEYHPSQWNGDCDKRIVHIDFAPAEVDAHYHPEVEVVGDLAHALWMLNERAARQPARLAVPEYRALRERMLHDFADHAGDETVGRIRPQKAVWEARRVLGASDLLLSDVGAHKMWVARNYHCDEPNTCLIPNGFSSMGFALPAAIGAKLALPSRRVLAIVGDGGFLMNVQEMETARRLNLDLVCLLWQDDGYGLIEWQQQRDLGRTGNNAFGNPDFVKLAESFGWNAVRIDRAAALGPALERAFATAGPSLVVIPIDYDENLKLSQRLAASGCG